MKKFKFSFSILVYVLCTLALLVLVGAIIFNAKTFFLPLSSATKKVSAVVFSVLCLILIVFVMLLLFCSFYVFKDKKLYFRLGIFKFNLGIETALMIKEYTKQQKLVLIFNDGKYSVIVINKKYYKDFVEEVKKINQNALFESESTTD